MTVLLEMKERLKLIYSKGEPFILPLAKFLLAFITFNTLNGRMGYMTQMDNVAVVLIGALTCSFLPTGAVVFFAALISLMHMYALSMEVALVGLGVYLVMYLLFFRFSPKDSLVVVVTPLLCVLKVPYVVPIVVGLVCGPMSVVSMICGVVVYYFYEAVIANASNIRTMGDDEALAKVQLMIESLIGNKAMVAVIVSFAVAVLVVYLIRRRSFDYSWTIAMIAGAMTEVVILLLADLLYDVNISVGGALLGSLLAIVIAKVVEFFRFCVDYSRTEKVQFEDDEYYYYVKAVPKMSVSMSTKTVKKINSQQARGAAGTRNGAPRQSARTSQPVRTTERGNGQGAASGRSVTTERAVSGRRGAEERSVNDRSMTAQRPLPGRGTGQERQMAGRGTTGRNPSGRGAQRPQGRSNVTIGRT